MQNHPFPECYVGIFQKRISVYIKQSSTYNSTLKFSRISVKRKYQRKQILGTVCIAALSLLIPVVLKSGYRSVPELAYAKYRHALAFLRSSLKRTGTAAAPSLLPSLLILLFSSDAIAPLKKLPQM
ncbi:hypothetical protein Tcan_01008, partial [Toxocara canis]